MSGFNASSFNWDAVRDYYRECRSYKATAESFGLTPAAVKKRAQRGQWGVAIDPYNGSGGTNTFESVPLGDKAVPSGGTRLASEGTNSLESVPSGDKTVPSGGTRLAVEGTNTFESVPWGDKTVPSGGTRLAVEGTNTFESVPWGDKDGNKNGNSHGNTPCGRPSPFRIPPEINEWDRLEAARYYLHEFGWAVHHLLPPDKGEDKEQGKRPWSKGWRDHKASDITDEDLRKVFGLHSTNNLGVVVRPPFVAVDLDSKTDRGQSVRDWLTEHPHLHEVPCERTGGGAHLHFVCRDLPAHILKARKPPTVAINARVTAELYLNGFNLVVAPSVHRSGHRYTWEVTGSIPEVRWADLAAWFGFENPSAPLPSAKAGGKTKAWWSAFKGDIQSLDIVGLFRQAGRLGECLDPDAGKWAVRCPWDHEHSGPTKEAAGSDTAIFADPSPGFKCLHAHCSERTLEDICLWFENRQLGTVDTHCRQMRGQFAAETLARDGLTSPWNEPAEDAMARLVQDFGTPFYYNGEDANGERKIAEFNYHYWAAQFAFENLLVYEPSANQFYGYVESRGIWCWKTEAAVRDQIAAYLLDYGRKLNQPILETHRTPERLSGMVVALKARCERREPFRKRGQVMHLANGMLHLDTDPPQFRSFSPLYFSLHQCPVPFDPEAVCPTFLSDLVFASMDWEDAQLLQLMGGLYLTGRNSWQKLLILTGTGGAGKGTLARIFQHLVGMENVKQLRTHLLDDRFELDNLDQVSLLVGSDVEGDFLSCKGAKVIKALTGGDPLTMEAKGGRKRDVPGEHNILITCNDRLRVKLDGDESAWKRRLLIIQFDRQAPCKIDDFERFLLEHEGSGIVNWFVIGALRLRELSRQRQDIPLTLAQEERIETLLAESDSLRLFVKQCVRRSPEMSATGDELLAAYENYCSVKGWVTLPRKRFEQQLGPLMMEFHQAAKRNDLKRGNTAKRGFMHVEVVQPTPPDSES